MTALPAADSRGREAFWLLAALALAVLVLVPRGHESPGLTFLHEVLNALTPLNWGAFGAWVFYRRPRRIWIWPVLTLAWVGFGTCTATAPPQWMLAAGAALWGGCAATTLAGHRLLASVTALSVGVLCSVLQLANLCGPWR